VEEESAAPNFPHDKYCALVSLAAERGKNDDASRCTTGDDGDADAVDDGVDDSSLLSRQKQMQNGQTFPGEREAEGGFFDESRRTSASS